MEPQTILSLLSQPNPQLVRDALRPGPPTVVPSFQVINSFEPWAEFNYENLYSIFKRLLNEPSDALSLSLIPEITGLDLYLIDEQSIEHQILSRDTIPAVNIALKQATHLLEQRYKKSYPLLHFLRGSHTSYETDDRYVADWGLVSPAVIENNLFPNLLPGETKTSVKWNSPDNQSTRNLGDSAEANNEWWEAIRQVAGYSSAAGVRYGFIITDSELCVMEFRTETVDSGIAAARNRRPTKSRFSAESATSAMSAIAESVEAMSLGSKAPSGSIYVPHVSECDLHVRAMSIPWEAHGNKKLTVRLGLFFLGLLAGYGPRPIGPVFAPIDWWSPKHYSKRIVQGTSLEEGGQTDVESDENEVEVQFNKRFTINRNDLHFNSDSGRYYFLDADGQSHWYNENLLIWDDSTEEWGHLRNMEWVPTQEQNRQSAASSSCVGESSQTGVSRKSKGKGRKKT